MDQKAALVVSFDPFYCSTALNKIITRSKNLKIHHHIESKKLLVSK